MFELFENKQKNVLDKSMTNWYSSQTHENRSVFKIPKKDSHFNLLQTLTGDQAMM